MNGSDLVLVGANFKIIALRKDTGQQVWETVLVSGIFNIGEPFVSLVVEDPVVYAHTKNEMFCVELLTGKILWQTKLASLGRSVASIALANASSRSGVTEAAQVMVRAREASSGGD